MGEYEFSFNKLSLQSGLNLKEMSTRKTITSKTHYNNLNRRSCYSGDSLQHESVYNSKSLDDNKTLIDTIKIWWKEKYPPFTRTCVSEQNIRNVLFGYSVGNLDVDDCIIDEWE